MSEYNNDRLIELEARLAEAERIVNAVALVHKEANLNGGRIVLTEGCALFLGAWQYRERHQATADSASAVQPERCCLDYPRCDCNSPPEPDNLPCGHPASLLLRSAETGEPLYCELCDDKSGRRDAEQCETELRAEVERLKTALKTVGDDYPGSSCQQWCYEAAGIRAPAEWPTREEAEKRAAELMTIGRATLGENDDWLCFQRPAQPKVTP